MNEALQKLIEFVESASPVIWAAYLKQVYVFATGNLAWAAVLGSGYVAIRKAAAYCWKQCEESSNDDWEIGLGLAWASIVIVGLVAVGLTIGAGMRFANPEFYAISLLLSSLGQ